MGFEIWYPMCRSGVGDKHFLPPANEVWGKVIFSRVFVKNSVHGGLPQCMLGYHTPMGPGTPPRPDIPLPPGPGSAPDQAPPEQTPTPGPGTPLRSAYWEIRSTSGRYASYWTAILFRISYLTKCLVH